MGDLKPLKPIPITITPVINDRVSQALRHQQRPPVPDFLLSSGAVQ